MTHPKQRRSHRAVGLAIAVAAASPALGCTSEHESPPRDAHIAIDASTQEDAGVADDASMPIDAFVIADAGRGPMDAGRSVDAGPDLDAGERDLDAYYYPDGVRG